MQKQQNTPVIRANVVATVVTELVQRGIDVNHFHKGLCFGEACDSCSSTEMSFRVLQQLLHECCGLLKVHDIPVIHHTFRDINASPCSEKEWGLFRAAFCHLYKLKRAVSDIKTERVGKWIQEYRHMRQYSTIERIVGIMLLHKTTRTGGYVLCYLSFC